MWEDSFEVTRGLLNRHVYVIPKKYVAEAGEATNPVAGADGPSVRWIRALAAVVALLRGHRGQRPDLARGRLGRLPRLAHIDLTHRSAGVRARRRLEDLAALRSNRVASYGPFGGPCRGWRRSDGRPSPLSSAW